MKTTVIEIGRQVACDLCNEDFTDSLEIGGGMVGSYAACPKCLVDYEKDHKPVKLRCPEGMAFADWVRKVLRWTDEAKIEIHSGTIEETLAVGRKTA